MFSKVLFGVVLMIAVVRGEGLLRNPCDNSTTRVCTGCDEYDICELKNGIYQPAGLYLKCPEAEKAICKDGSCVAGSCSIFNTGFSFTVKKPGIYPHPFNCTKYLTVDDTNVTPLQAKEKECPPKFLFDATTGRCSLNSTSNFCRPISYASCLTDEGTEFPIRDFSKFHFTCTKDTATISECPEGRIFIAHYGDCWDISSPYLSGGKCRGTGKFYHNDCSKYNECTGVDKTPVTKTCPVGQRFNYYYEKCVPIKCYT